MGSIVFHSFVRSGVVEVTINSVDYMYFVDGGFIEYLEKRAVKDPWGTLNFIKSRFKHRGFVRVERG